MGSLKTRRISGGGVATTSPAPGSLLTSWECAETTATGNGIGPARTGPTSVSASATPIAASSGRISARLRPACDRDAERREPKEDTQAAEREGDRDLAGRVVARLRLTSELR